MARWCGHVLAVAVERGDDLGHALLLQRAAFGLGLAHVGQLEARGGREAQAARLRHQPRGVAHRRHLDARLGAVDERVEHLGIDVAAILDLEVLVEDLPHRVGSGPMIGRVVARALAGGDHLEAAGARPVDVLADERGLVAPGQRVDDARLARLARQQRPGQRVGLDVDHDDVLAVPRSPPCTARCRCRDRRSPRSTTSMSGCAIRAIASSVTKVLPVLSASPSDFAADLLPGPAHLDQPLAGARGIRSARPTRCMPGVRRTCDRNMVPNLPAPIWPMRTGRPAAARSRKHG